MKGSNYLIILAIGWFIGSVITNENLYVYVANMFIATYFIVSSIERCSDD